MLRNVRSVAEAVWGVLLGGGFIGPRQKKRKKTKTCLPACSFIKRGRTQTSQLGFSFSSHTMRRYTVCKSLCTPKQELAAKKRGEVGEEGRRREETGERRENRQERRERRGEGEKTQERREKRKERERREKRKEGEEGEEGRRREKTGKN